MSGKIFKEMCYGFSPFRDSKDKIAALWPDPTMRWLKRPLCPESRGLQLFGGQHVLSPQGGQTGSGLVWKPQAPLGTPGQLQDP